MDQSNVHYFIICIIFNSARIKLLIFIINQSLIMHDIVYLHLKYIIYICIIIVSKLNFFNHINSYSYCSLQNNNQHRNCHNNYMNNSYNVSFDEL